MKTLELLKIEFTDFETNKKYSLIFEFKLQDCWVGVYWDSNNIWVCLFPMLPIHLKRSSEI